MCEDLRDSAPPDIFYEDALFIFGCFAAFRIESVRELDRGEVVPTLLFKRTLAVRILWADAIVVRV